MSQRVADTHKDGNLLLEFLLEHLFELLWVDVREAPRLDDGFDAFFCVRHFGGLSFFRVRR